MRCHILEREWMEVCVCGGVEVPYEGLSLAAANCQEMAEMEGGKGLLRDSASCLKIVEMGGERGLP